MQEHESVSSLWLFRIPRSRVCRTEMAAYKMHMQVHVWNAYLTICIRFSDAKGFPKKKLPLVFLSFGKYRSFRSIKACDISVNFSRPGFSNGGIKRTTLVLREDSENFQLKLSP